MTLSSAMVMLHGCLEILGAITDRMGGPPVTMEDTAAHVHTMTLWPSLKPSVCSMKPREEKMMLMQRPPGAASQDRRPASRNPVRQQAAESPKQAPACAQ